MGRTAEQRDMKRGDQIREEQAGAAEKISIRVLGKNLSIPTSASLSRSMCVRILLRLQAREHIKLSRM